MTKKYIGLSLLALGLAGAAYAAEQAPMGDPLGGKTVTKAEFLAKHGEMFDKMDANHDGKLDEADRAAHMGQMFDTIDTDHNGSISRDEFAAAHQKMGGEHGGPGGKHDGPGGPEGPGKGGGMMMLKMADANKDGAVSRDEFMTMAGQHFDKMDANHDGQLTKEERKAAHDKMKKGKGGKRGEHGGHEMPPPPAQ